MIKITTQIKHIINAYHNSIAGLKTAYKEELAFKHDLILFIIGVILAAIMPISDSLKLLLYLSLVLILIAELVNTAIEKTIDRIGLEKHELSRKAKDIGSAVVFISLINALFMWLFVFIKYVI